MRNIYPINGDTIKKAADVIKYGGVVAMPTDTVYGLSVDVSHARAVARIYDLKKRSPLKPLIAHIPDVMMLPSLVITDERIMEIARKSWPGATTLVFDRMDGERVFDYISPGVTVALRIPDNSACLDIIKMVGSPIVSTSANLEGQPVPVSASGVYGIFGDEVDMILDGGVQLSGVASKIIDLTGGGYRILR